MRMTRAARRIQQAWHDDEPRRRARDAWLAELALRLQFKEKVRWALSLLQRWMRMVPKYYYYRQLKLATHRVQVRTHMHAPSCGLAPLTHTCTHMVQCWIRQIQARMHAYMLQRKRYWAELAWQVMSHSTVGSNFIPRKHVRAKLVYVCLLSSRLPSNLHLTLTHFESTTSVSHVAGVTSTGTSTAITLPSMSDSARRAA